MILKGVMTVAEAAERWGLETSTLRHAIREGRLRAVKSGGTWLVAEADMAAAYGDPPEAHKESKD